MKSLKLKENLYWVGSLDPNLRVFDIIMSTEFGTTYNSYCIKGRDRTVLIETVKLKFFDEYIERLKEITDIQNIEYIIVNHTEPDHAGSIEKMLELNPNISIIGSKTAIDFLKHICNREFKYIEVKNGDGLSLGDKTLKFIDAKCLHWPDSMYTYLVEDKVLFSCDSFGAHYSLDTILQSTIKNQEDYLKAFTYYYNMILSPYKTFFLDAIKRIEDLEIDMICPGHGPVLDEDPWKIIKLSKEYSTDINPNKNKVVVIPYVSAYGYTGELALSMKKAIEEAGLDVKIFDLVYADKNEVLAEIGWADGILFGSPTILGEALKPIWDIMTDIYSVTHRGKLASAFGSYGWSGEAVPDLMERIKQLKMKPFKEGFKIRFKPSDNQLSEAYEFGKEFAEAVKASK
jgi:flavorubredoxin